MVLNDRKDERMALNKKGGLGKGLGKGIDSLTSNAYAEATKKKDSAAADKKPFRRRKEEALSSSRPYGRTKFFDFG